MSRRKEIIERITLLESQVGTATEEIATLKKELTETPADLLDRDDNAIAQAAIKQKNDALRRAGLIPPEAE